MPKMKTNGGAKKRFKVTGKLKKNRVGKVVSITRAMSGKRHGMVKRSNRQIRENRGTRVACKADTVVISKVMPYIKRKRKNK